MLEPTSIPHALLLAHIAALETELAKYADKYGFSDEARRLLHSLPEYVTPHEESR